jgi:hypothetical protein
MVVWKDRITTYPCETVARNWLVGYVSTRLRDQLIRVRGILEAVCHSWSLDLGLGVGV